MNTHVEVTPVEPGLYSVKATEGHVVTRQRLAVDQGYLERTGIDGADLVREVCDILLEKEALAAIPAVSTVEQLVAQYPYLSSELQKRLPPGTPGVQPLRPARITAERPADRPTHT